MDPVWTALGLLLTCCAGSFLQRVAGFGFGIFVMMFFPYLLPSHAQAAALSGLFSLATCTLNALKARKHIPWKQLLPLLLAALVTIPLAVRFSVVAPAAVMKRLLGGVFILLSLYFLFFSQRLRFRPTPLSGGIVGAVSGVLGGLFSTGGPPVVLYLVQTAPEKEVYFAAIQAYFAVTNLYTTATRALSGILTGQVLGAFCLGIFGCLLGNYLGGKVFHRLDGEKLRRVVYLGMILSGITMLLT